MAQNQKESVASNQVRSYLAQLKDDVGRKSLKTSLGLGIDVVLGFVGDALKDVSDARCVSAASIAPGTTRRRQCVSAGRATAHRSRAICPAKPSPGARGSCSSGSHESLLSPGQR